MTALEPITDEIDLLPAQRPIQTSAVDQLMMHAQAMQTAKQLADALCDTDLVPAVFRGKPGNGAAAILYGSELGLNPIQSLQNIFIVHGQPAIYARTAVALVKRHGYQIRTVEESDTSVTVSGTDPRTGQVEVSTWDLKRAERAGFTSNKKYQTEPRAMLWAKASMEVCRRIAPDVLLGIAYSSEELEAETAPQRPQIISSRRGVDGLRAAIATAPVIEPEIIGDEVEEDDDEPEAAKVSTMAPATRRKWVGRLGDLFTEAEADDEDRPLLMRELLVLDHTPDTVDVLTDDELRLIVNLLNGMAKDGTLGERVNDILNAAVLRETGAAE